LIYQSKVWEQEIRQRKRLAPKTLEKDGGAIRTILKNVPHTDLTDIDEVREFIRRHWKNRAGTPKSRRVSDQERALKAWFMFITFLAEQLSCDAVLDVYSLGEVELELLQLRNKIGKVVKNGYDSKSLVRILRRVLKEVEGAE